MTTDTATATATATTTATTTTTMVFDSHFLMVVRPHYNQKINNGDFATDNEVEKWLVEHLSSHEEDHAIFKFVKKVLCSPPGEYTAPRDPKDSFDPFRRVYAAVVTAEEIIFFLKQQEDDEPSE